MNLPQGELDLIVRRQRTLRHAMRILPVIDAQRLQLNVVRSTHSDTKSGEDIPTDGVIASSELSETEEAPLSGYSSVLTADTDYNDVIAEHWMKFL